MLVYSMCTAAGGLHLQGVGVLNRRSLKAHSDSKQQAVKVAPQPDGMHFPIALLFFLRLKPRIRSRPPGFRPAVTMPLVFHRLEVFSAAVG